MPEIRTVTTLRRKRDEISASIRLYEKTLEQARADLAHITAAIRIFAVTDRPQDVSRYVDFPTACSSGASRGRSASLRSPRATLWRSRGPAHFLPWWL